MTWHRPQGSLCRRCAGQSAQADLSDAERQRVREADVVVLGAGTFGAFVAEQVVSNSQAGVAVIDAGDWAATANVHSSQSVFNGESLPLREAARQMHGSATSAVRVVPWRSTADFPGIARVIGGRSIFWAGWSPMLRPSELRRWPRATRRDLRHHSETVRRMAGVGAHPAMNGPLQAEVMVKLRSWAASLPASTWVGLAPLAIGRWRFGNDFEKFSSVAGLKTALETKPSQLTVLTNCRVRRLSLSDNRIVGVETCRGPVEIGPEAAVVLALGTVETTRLVLASLERDQSLRHGVGRTLMTHLRTDVYARQPSNKPARSEAAAALVRGRIGDRHWHLQVTATVLDGISSGDQASVIADLGCLDPDSALDPRYVHLIVRGFGEQEPTAHNFVELHHEADECGIPRAAVHLKPTKDDLSFWNRLHRVAIGALAALSAGVKTECLKADGTWSTDLPDAAACRRDLGSSHHEGGTLQAGGYRAPSDATGRLRITSNGYVVGPALFPRLGSVGPVLPGLALARALALRLGTGSGSGR